MSPAATSRFDSSFLDFSVIHSSTAGGRLCPPFMPAGDLASTSCVVTAMGESKITSIRGAYGGGG